MSEVFGGRFSSRVYCVMWDDQEIEVLVVGVVWIRIFFEGKLLAFLATRRFRERRRDGGIGGSCQINM
jgi:hypothetical protein